jgi:hypothetical protein
VLLAILIAATAGCGQRDNELRQAVLAVKRLLVERDYSGAWEFLEAGSRKAISEQLRGRKELKEGDPTWQWYREQCGLSREDVLTLDARGYFIAFLKGLDRHQPETRKRQVEETRGKEIVSIKIDGKTAQVTTKSTSGVIETDTWIREDRGWKVRADVAR